MLSRCIERQLMLVFLPEEVVCQTTAIDDVLGLLGDIRFKRFQIELVTSTMELVGSMIFDAQSAKLGRTIVRTKTEGIHIEFTDFGETVAIHIVRITVTVRLVHGDAINIVLRY